MSKATAQNWLLYTATFCALLCFSCKKYKNAEEPVYSKGGANHEKLDKRALPLLAAGKNHILKSGDTVISWTKERWDYEEFKRIGNSAFYSIRKYNRDLNIIYECNFFQNGIPIGYEKQYNDDGSLTKKRDFDGNFNFSVSNLIDKVKKDYGRDISVLVAPKEAVYITAARNRVAKYIVVLKIGREYKRIEIDGEHGYVWRVKTVYP